MGDQVSPTTPKNTIVEITSSMVFFNEEELHHNICRYDFFGRYGLIIDEPNSYVSFREVLMPVMRLGKIKWTTYLVRNDELRIAHCMNDPKAFSWLVVNAKWHGKGWHLDGTIRGFV